VSVVMEPVEVRGVVTLAMFADPAIALTVR